MKHEQINVVSDVFWMEHFLACWCFHNGAVVSTDQTIISSITFIFDLFVSFLFDEILHSKVIIYQFVHMYDVQDEVVNYISF